MLIQRLKRIRPGQTGSWCNRQHGGLLIRSVRVQIPPALLEHLRVAQR
jgi:hypothetical protein